MSSAILNDGGGRGRGQGAGAEHKVKTGKHNVDYNTINQLWSSIITHFKHLNLSLELSQVTTISQFFFYAQSEREKDLYYS